MKTSIIKKAQIEKLFFMQDYVFFMEEAFRVYGNNGVQMPSKVYLNFPKGDLRCMPVYIQSLNIAGVKNVNVHTGNKELPTVMATITLFDADTGYPIAMMDGTHITKMRTGAAGAVAAKYLSREDSREAGFIGTGTQAYTQLEALLTVRKLRNVVAYDLSDEHCQRFVGYARSLGLNARAGSIEDAVKVDILTTVTPARKPVVDHVYQGVHINAIGADAKGKQELNSDILTTAKIVVDNWEQASHSGEINVPVSSGIITEHDIYADIGEIVTGKKKGREGNEISIFDSTGLAIQDIYVAYQVFKKARPDLEFDFFS